MRTVSMILACVAAFCAAPAAAYVASPLALARTGSARVGLSAHGRTRSSAPSMQLNPQDKSFRRAVALRAEGDDDLPRGRFVPLSARCALPLASREVHRGPPQRNAG